MIGISRILIYSPLMFSIIVFLGLPQFHPGEGGGVYVLDHPVNDTNAILTLLI